LNLFESISTCFSKYADFEGSASRSEYWWFAFFCVICDVMTDMIDGSAIDEMGIFNATYLIITFIPSLAVAVRRLHDIGKSGWNILWAFTIIGIIPLIYWNCKKGKI